MSNDTAVTQTTNIVPVQGIFMPEPTFSLISLIGPAGTPFYATINPLQSGLTITDSTIDSTIIGGSVPSSATFTNVATTTGTISTPPAGSDNIANKAYVDAVAQGLSFKQPAVVTTSSNITLSGLQTIDSVALVAGNRVLVRSQTNQADNGIYVAASGAWARAADANTYDEYLGAYLFILEGTVWGGSAWVCTNQRGGTLGVTPITFVQFSNNATYTAGTGLQLIGFQFSMVNTGVTAGAYGSASSVPTYTVNAQGQLTLAADVSIAIAASQITSGTIASSLISGSYSGITGVGTLLDLTVTNTINGSINGNAATATTAVSSATSTNLSGGSTGAIPYQTAAGATTFLSSGTGVLVGGSAPSYTTSPALVGTNFTGTASGLSIGGNAATATTATNIAGGTVNAIPYQNAAGSSVFLAAGTVGYILQTNSTSSPPAWIDPNGLTVGYATNISGGVAGAVPYQSAVGTTGFSAAGTSSQVLLSGGTGSPTWSNQSALSVGYSNNLNGGAAGYLPYQTGSNTTGFIATSTDGYVLTLASGLPAWAALPATGVTIVDDTTTNATRYLTFTSATSGNITTENVSSTRLQFNPSTGALTSTSLTPTNPLGVAYGGTGVTASSGANSVVLRDANGNIFSNIVDEGFASVAASGTPIVLTVASVPNYTITGSGGQTFQLPNATTLNAGTNYRFDNNQSSGAVLVNNNSGTLIVSIPSGGFVNVYLLANGTAAGTWDRHDLSPSNVSWSTNTFDYPGSITSATWNGAVVAYNRGGTGQSSYAAGDIIYASATNTLSKLAAGTNGYVLTLASGLPSWSALPATGVSITNDTTTNSSLYPLFTTATSGSVTTQYVSSTKYTYNPSLGTLSSPQVNASNGFHINNLTIASSYSIPSGSSAMSAGPVSVSNGVSVTVPNGSRWVVV